MPALGADNIYDIIVAVLNENTPSTLAITADYAAQIALPFIRYVELGESYTYFTRSAGDKQQRQVISDGQFQLSVFAQNRETARQIGRQVMNILDDYKQTYTDGRIMYIEPISAIFIPEPRAGPSTPAVFHRAITFALTEQRGI